MQLLERSYFILITLLLKKEKNQNVIIYLLYVSSSTIMLCSRKLILAFNILIDIKILTTYGTVSE